MRNLFIKITFFCGFLLITGCANLPPNSELLELYEVSTSKPYDEVLAEVQVAIAEHNFRITGHSRIGKVIRERGTANFPDYDTLQFCNLTHAKTLLQMSPHAVKYMPCNMVIYFYQGKTIVKTHLMPTTSENIELNRFLLNMNQELKQIVDFAVEN
jgi:uncharacterized protein (DUF302 family)